jgi:hypothetical protein
LCENDSTVLSGSEDGRIFAWDTVTAKLTHQLWHDESMQKSEASKRKVVSSVKVCPTRREWCSAAGDGKWMGHVSSLLLDDINFAQGQSQSGESPSPNPINNDNGESQTGRHNPPCASSLLVYLDNLQ